MVRNKMFGGHALSIAVGITTFLLLMAGGAQARFDLNISPHSDINNSFIMHRLDAEITSNRDLGIQENKKLLPVKGIEKAAVKISAKADWFISDTETGGDCTFIGTWNAVSKTCTLTTDLNKTIVIDSDNIILDGNGHTITGSNSEYGIYLSGRSGVTIKNTNVRYFYDGIYLHDSNNNTLNGNNALNNTYGIYLYYSSNNNLFNNTMKENSYNFVVYGWSDSHFNNQIDYSNTVDGKPIYYVKNANNTVYDSSTNAGFFYCISCLNVTIRDIELLKNDAGITFWNTTFSKIQNVTVSNNGDGIVLLESGNNMLIGNNVNSNDNDGIYLEYSSNNTLIGNNANSNNGNGIDLYESGNNSLSGNNANSNNGNGIYLYESGNNTLSGNNASNNSNGIYLDYSSNNTLFDNTMAENSFNFGLYGESGSDFNNQIDYSNTVDGKPIYYVKNANNTVYDSSTNAGLIYCINCINVTIKDIELLKNEVGILFWNTTSSKIQNVTVSNNYYGIELYVSSNNTLSGNNASNNYGGIVLWESGNNTLSGNNANSNNEIGIVVYESGNNTLSDNNALNDNYYGIVLLGSSNNMLSDNNAHSNDEVGIVLLISSNNTLGGNTALNNYDGIVLLASNNNTLSDNNASNNYEGIYLEDSNSNTLSDNNASNNSNGIYLDYSSNNKLSNNTMTENTFNFGLYGWSDSDFINQIDYSNTVDGKPIYYVKNANNTVYDSSTKAGLFYCISCLNVTIKDIELLNNDVGIFFWNTTNSKIQNVTVSNNDDGIVLLDSSNNMLSGNNANLNDDDGIYLYYSSNNTLSDNTASNNYDGIYLEYSSDNTLNGNNVNSNNDDGIDLYSSSNKIYNNVFNNTNNLYIEDSVSIWNINKTSGTNIIGGSYLGGNFWANPSVTGFGQTCADANSDGICDSAYKLDSYNIDYLPLAYTSVTPTPTIPIEVPLPINATTGIVNTTVIVAAPSANLTMTIPNGTRISDATGNPLTPLTNLSIITASGLTANATTALNDKVLLGQVVDLRPNGTLFDTPIQIRFNYTLTSGVDENSLIVQYFNTASNSWEEMLTVERNTAQHYIIANISHFSTFALVGTTKSSTSSSGGSSSGGTYPPGYNTITKAVQATATAVQTAIATATPVVAKTEVSAATTAKPEATGTTTETTKEPASEPTTPGFGAIIAVFAVAMIASLLKNNRTRR